MTRATRDLIYTRPWLYEKQERAVFEPARYSVIEASTKSGKTVGCLVWLIEKAMAGVAEQNRWWVAPIFAQTKIAFRRAKRAMPQDIYIANESELTLMLANGGIIWFKSAEKPDSLFGEDVFDVVLDEATRMREEAFHAVRTTLSATGGHARIIGNVKGRKNWAYRLARKAEAGEPDTAYHKITAFDAIQAGVLTAEEVEDAKRQLPDAIYRELYLAEASEDEGNPFGIAAIREIVAPISEAEPVIWGWDLAKSVDWTVGIGLDANGAVCRFNRFQKPWQETIGAIRWATGGTRALVDSTGVGDPILEGLQREGGNYEGLKFTAQSKQQLMEGLAVAIQKQDIRVPEGPIVSELESFEYVYTRSGVHYSAPEGMHDDCVAALALAVSHRRPGLWVM